jgi:hypothetical protein
MGDNTATDQRVPAALTIANLEFLLRFLLPGSAIETNTNYLKIECRLAIRGPGWGQLRDCRQAQDPMPAALSFLGN